MDDTGLSQLEGISKAIAAEMLKVVHKMQAAESQIRAKNYSTEKLIQMCANALVAGEELASMLTALRDKARTDDNLRRALEQLEYGAGRGSNMLATLDSVLASRRGADPELEALKRVMQQVDRDALRSAAQKGAKARHKADPKQLAKERVHECWVTWQQKPARYRSAAAFAKDMLDKFDELTSPQVVERWVREWKKGASRTLPAE